MAPLFSSIFFLLGVLYGVLYATGFVIMFVHGLSSLRSLPVIIALATFWPIVYIVALLTAPFRDESK